MGDPLREQLRVALHTRRVTPYRASLEAGLPGNTLGKFLRGASKTLAPETCEAVARYFGWPVPLVHQWQGTLPPPSLRTDPRLTLSATLAELFANAEDRQPILDLVDRLLAVTRRPERPRTE